MTMGSLGEAVLDLRGEATGLYQDVDKAGNVVESQLRSIGSKMTALGTQLTKTLTLPIVGVGVAAGKMSMDFETSMAHIRGLVGKSQSQVDAWSKQIMALGPQLGKSPRELAEALYFVASAGIEDAKAMDVVTAAAKAASAGLGDTQTVADAVSSAMNAYAGSNLDAAKATGILVATVREGKGEANEIAPALGRVIPIAAQMGIGFDQVGAAMASMTLVGFDAAESATNLSGIMSAFLKPSKQAEDALAAYGLSAKQVRDTIQKDGLLKALDLLRVKIGDDDEALAAIFPNIRGFRGALSLTGENAEQTAGIFERLAGTTEDDLNKAFESVTNTGAFQFQQAMSQLQDLLITIGNVIMPIVLPILKDLTETVKKIADGFANLPQPVQQAIVVALELAAALGPVLIIGGQLVTAIGAIAGVLSGPLVLAVGAAIAAGVAIAQNWETIWPQIQGVVEPVVNAIRSIIETVLGAISTFVARHGEEIKAWLQSAWERVQTIIQTVIEIIRATVVPVFEGIARFLQEHRDTIVRVLEGAWNAIRTVVDTALATIQGILNTVLAAVRGDWETVWTNIKTAAETIWNALAAQWNTFMTVTLPAAWESFKMLFQMAWDQFWGTTVPAAWESFKMLFQMGWDALWGTVIPGIFNAFKTAFETAWDNFWNGVKNTIEAIWTGIKLFLQNMINGIVDALNGLIREFNNGIGKITGQIPEIARVAWVTEAETGRAMTSIGESVASMGVNVDGVMKSVEQSVGRRAPGMFEPITAAADGMNSRVSGIINGLLGSLNSFLSGLNGAQASAPSGPAPRARATGGTAWPGMSYLVGERRPELFTPNVPGRITPNVRTSTSATTNNYYLSAQYAMQDERSLADDVRLLQMLSS